MTDDNKLKKAPNGSSLRASLVGLSLFCFSLFIYTFNLDHGLYVDELYHLLPAQSVLADGSLSLADGEYTRADLYTRFVASIQSVFGESVKVARMSSAVTVSAFIALVYLVFRSLIGKREALTSAFILAILPSTIYLAQFIRFYGLHQILFFIGAISIYYLTAENLSRPMVGLLAIISTISFGLAYHFQMTTLIGVLAVIIWVVLYLSNQVLNPYKRNKINASLLVFLLVGGLLLGIALLILGKVQGLLETFRYAAPWSADNVDNVLYYHRHLRYHFPVFWLLFPLACLVAFYYKPKPAFFFASIFLTSVLVFSFGGMKDERYILFLYPFAIGIWAIACFPILGMFKILVLKNLVLLDHWLPSGKMRIGLANGIMVSVSLFAILSNHAFPLSFHLLNGQQYRHEVGDWSMAVEHVQPLVDKADVVLTTNDVESLFYFGRYDFNFSEFIIGEAAHQNGQEQAKEFILDRRTGKPVLSQLESLEKILKCYRSGVFLGDARKWYKKGQGLGAAGVELIEAYTDRIETDRITNLVVRTWNNEGPISDEQQCTEPYRFVKPQ